MKKAVGSQRLQGHDNNNKNCNSNRNISHFFMSKHTTFIDRTANLNVDKIYRIFL